jgi:hypothetical protein
MEYGQKRIKNKVFRIGIGDMVGCNNSSFDDGSDNFYIYQGFEYWHRKVSSFFFSRDYPLVFPFGFFVGGHSFAYQ